MIHIKADTPLELWEKINKTLINLCRFADVKSGTRVIFYDCIFETLWANDNKFDLWKHAWFGGTKKMAFLRTYYIDREEIEKVKNTLKNRNHIQFSNVSLYFKRNKTGTRAGSCLSSVDFIINNTLKTNKIKEDIRVHLRSSEVTRRFYADLVAMQEIINEVLGPSDIPRRVIFYCSNAWITSIHAPVMHFNWDLRKLVTEFNRGESFFKQIISQFQSYRTCSEWDRMEKHFKYGPKIRMSKSLFKKIKERSDEDFKKFYKDVSGNGK